MKPVYDIFESPIGIIYIIMDETGVRKVILTQEYWETYQKTLGGIQQDRAFCSQAVKELEEYFDGKRREFTVPLSIEGTAFNKKVWQALLEIPYGETCNYGDISYAVGSPKAHRAVGQANRNNPLPIFVPCHRVIGKNGNLTGYMGKQGLSVKEFLLNLEQGNKTVTEK